MAVKFLKIFAVCLDEEQRLVSLHRALLVKF